MKKILDKKNFQRIKCMNYPQMVRFITNIYESGFKDGQADSAGLNETDVRELLLSIRGIGPKRLGQIMEALNMKLDERDLRRGWQSILHPTAMIGC